MCNLICRGCDISEPFVLLKPWVGSGPAAMDAGIGERNVMDYFNHDFLFEARLKIDYCMV